MSIYSSDFRDLVGGVKDLANAVRKHGDCVIEAAQIEAEGRLKAAQAPQRIVHVEQRGGPHADSRQTVPSALRQR